ncbi:MAG TPA: GNAT family N-acetyltransferase [Candidatus Angelobacter sp.]|jgi:GNAT superfamily N-acetyltransferase|nr:GNAT family N-acetyltransferase [Candidatus Angelobacter sp.]
MGEVAGLLPPEPLADHHEIGSFHSGEASLDDWLKRRARANQVSGASRTYVVCEDKLVIGYYALASGVVAVESAPGRFRRNMPNPIPVAVLARLAVDLSWHGRGIGRAMFRDAARRVAHAADAIGIRSIVVHAISEQAENFYVALGFDPSPREPMTLMVTLADIRAALSQKP